MEKPREAFVDVGHLDGLVSRLKFTTRQGNGLLVKFKLQDLQSSDHSGASSPMLLYVRSSVADATERAFSAPVRNRRDNSALSPMSS